MKQKWKMTQIMYQKKIKNILKSVKTKKNKYNQKKSNKYRKKYL